jgi:hypothetical protein
VNGDDREQRLRQRIDQLTDERDDARARADLVPRLRKRIYEITRSRDLWKFRARAWRPVRSKAKR